MNSPTPQDRWIVRKLFDTLRVHGPLGTARRVNIVMRDRLERVPGGRLLFLSLERLLKTIQHYLDSSFDRRYGVNTSGGVPLKDLAIAGKDVEDFFWYEPLSVKIFKQIMHYLDINFGEFEFIDFGSGKGRVLLLASDYGFKKIIGVEFAQELHRSASKNIAIWERFIQKPSNIMSLCMDAVEFPIPNVPLVIFFYSPFKGKVMKQVLNNIGASFAMNPREIVLIFYGPYDETTELFKIPGFQGRELKLRADWSQFIKYRGFLFTSLVSSCRHHILLFGHHDLQGEGAPRSR